MDSHSTSIYWTPVSGTVWALEVKNEQESCLPVIHLHLQKRPKQTPFLSQLFKYLNTQQWDMKKGHVYFQSHELSRIFILLPALLWEGQWPNHNFFWLKKILSLKLLEHLPISQSTSLQLAEKSPRVGQTLTGTLDFSQKSGNLWKQTDLSCSHDAGSVKRANTQGRNN